MNVPCIYGLFDPAEPGHIRYVGLATNRNRFWRHADEARSESGDTYKLRWVRKLLREGRYYKVQVLQEMSIGCSRDLLGFVEMCYIKSLREIGHRLTNATDGGDGSRGLRDDVRIARNVKISQILQGRPVPPERCARIAATLTGRRQSEETRNRRSESVRKAKNTPEARLATSIASKQAWARRKGQA